MISKLNRKDRVRVLVYVILIALCITMLPLTVLASGEAAADVSTEVTIGNVDVTYSDGDTWKVYMTGGAVVDSERDKVFEKGTTMRFYVSWSVPSTKIGNINEGDYFYVSMPTTYFTFSDLGPVDIMSSKNKLIGTYTVSDQKMKVVFSSIVDNPKTKEIKSGWLMAKGSLNSSEIPDNQVSMGDITIPVTATKSSITENNNNEPVDSYESSKQGQSDSLYKTSYMNNDMQAVSWYIKANRDMYRAKYNSLNIDTAKTGLIIEDKLEDGQKINDIQFYHTYHYAYKDDDEALYMAAQSFDVYYDTGNTFTLITENSGESYADFRARVISEGRTGIKPAYGIWQDRYVIISLGDVPGKLKMPLTYGDLSNMIAANTYKGMTVPQSVKDDTLAVYGDLFYNSTDDLAQASAYSLNLKINATVTGYDREIDNEAYMQWGGETYTTAGAQVRFESIAGGAELGAPGSVTIRKYDKDTNGTLDGVKFKLQKKNDSGIYEDYTPSSGDAVRTTSGGSIVFEDLEKGDYKVVETYTLPGYLSKITFKEGDGTFSITGGEDGTIYVDAYNQKETVKDQTDNPSSDAGTPTVLGQEDYGDDDKVVLGQNAKTADVTNIAPLLTLMLVVLIILLIVSLQYTIRKN